ncbi:hypothetical protein MKW98_022673 [Papaver atlanticum]|uniref:Inositol 1,3,4-trisphosphate 5/6-kinase ATP-grasp domain-containing protein n=1 Tax=Papaver atlanticum TaxID=357466 RepID=A0AAD4T1W0_9MAGN|nr:hypothetical protein MKW98_022673 [Papaver atlanticum]
MLGLRLFNIDMIREHESRDQFSVISINYFPGVYYPAFHSMQAVASPSLLAVLKPTRIRIPGGTLPYTEV